MASFRTAVLREEDEMPKVIRVPLAEAGVFTPGSNPHHIDVKLPSDSIEPHPAQLLLTDDSRTYFRRWGDDVRAEFRRACARVNFYRHWRPDMKAW